MLQDYLDFYSLIDPGTIVNKYGPSLASGFDTLYLDREPTHYQESEVTNLELTHDLNDDLQMIVKYTYSTRDFHQMNDNDGSISTVPLLGVGAALGLPPVEATVCFGGDIQFCELANSDRTYDFPDVETENRQAEINVVSSYDDSFNYTFGYYWYDDTTDNEYRVQTMGTQLIGDFGIFIYAPVLFGLTGLDYSNKGGFAFYDQLLRLMAVIPSVQQVQAGLITDPATAQGILTAYGTLVATINAMPDMTVQLISEEL